MLAIYTRLSREDEDSTSIKNQTYEGKEFARINNFKDFKIYNEGEGVSGTLEIEDRPIFHQLLKDILTGNIHAVWFRHQNRYERNSLTFFMFIDACKKNSVRIFLADKEFDYNDPNQLLMGGILSNINSFNALSQSVQTKKVLLNNVKQGKAHGKPPYGFTTDKEGYLVIDKDEAETIKDIYKLSLSGKGYGSIARILNEKGVQTRYAKLGKGTYFHTNKYTKEKTTFNKSETTWKGATISHIIKNSIYKGERVWKGKIYKVPTIVSSEYWQQVNDNLKNNRNNSGKKVEHKYLLKGLMSCARCGNNYYGKSRVNKKDHVYVCSSSRVKSCGNRSINIDRIEEYIWYQLFINGGISEEIKKAYVNRNEDEKIKEFEENLKNLYGKKTTLTNKIDKALDKILEGSISEDLLTDKITTHEKEIKQINTDIESIEKNISITKNAKSIVENYHTEFHQLTSITTYEEKKEIVKKYIKRITLLSVGKDYSIYLKIEFNIDIPPRGGVFITKNPHPVYGMIMPSSIDHLYVKIVDRFNKVQHPDQHRSLSGGETK